MRRRPHHGGGQRAQHKPDNRKGREHAAADLGARAQRQDGAERECASERTNHDETLASSNVAIDRSVAIAARTTGSATAAPVPTPRRI